MRNLPQVVALLGITVVSYIIYNDYFFEGQRIFHQLIFTDKSLAVSTQKSRKEDSALPVSASSETSGKHRSLAKNVTSLIEQDHVNHLRNVLLPDSQFQSILIDHRHIEDFVYLKFIPDLVFKHLLTPQVNCSSFERMGNKGDGGWDVCTMPDFLPKDPCLIYSFGIRNDWSFDDAISQTYKCEVFSFDPTVKMEQHRRSDKITFYPIGLGGENQTMLRNNPSRPLKTLAQFLQMLNHTNMTVDVLKMDIESSEWRALKSIVDDGVLIRVKQLAVEFHMTIDYRQVWEILHLLHKEGFRIWHTHPNVHSKFVEYASTNGENRTERSCHESYFINERYMKLQNGKRKANMNKSSHT